MDSDPTEKKSNVITTYRNDDKPKFHDLIKASHVKSEVVDLTSPAKQGPVKKSKSMLDSYGSQATEDVKPGDFLSRLSSSSKAIDFNAKPTINGVRIKEESSSANTQEKSRKRKYKLVDNEPPKTVTTSVASGKSEKLPEDKTQLIKIVKDRLDKDDYKRLLNSLKTYQATSCVSVLYDEMSSVFAKPEFHFMLRGMSRFVKEGRQRDEFDKLLINNNIP